MKTDESKIGTMKKVNAIGKYYLENIKTDKFMKKNQKLKFTQAMVAVSPPLIQQKDGTEFDLEDELSTKPSFDL